MIVERVFRRNVVVGIVRECSRIFERERENVEIIVVRSRRSVPVTVRWPCVADVPDEIDGCDESPREWAFCW